MRKKKLSLSTAVYDINGKKKGSVNLPKEIFCVKTSDRLLAQYKRVYLANQRQGTASTKTRGEVTGSTRKIYRQKGTGRARHGDIRAPIFVGGGIVHGPKPRDYSLKMNKKQKQKALFYSLSEKFRKGDIYFIDGLLKIKAKTKETLKILANFKLDQQKPILVVYPKENSKNLILAIRNLEKVDFCQINSLNPYQILKANKIIFAKEALLVLPMNQLRRHVGTVQGSIRSGSASLQPSKIIDENQRSIN
jgi:large subunit ribosomal protein L4